jgi:hypothetical protein
MMRASSKIIQPLPKTFRILFEAQRVGKGHSWKAVETLAFRVSCVLGVDPHSLLRNGEFLIRHPRMLLAGIQAKPW